LYLSVEIHSSSRSFLSVETGECACSHENLQKHGPRQLAGIRVLQRWMITRHHNESAGQRVFDAVTEDEARSSLDATGSQCVGPQSVPPLLSPAKLVQYVKGKSSR
jgi:hypothetical protein